MGMSHRPSPVYRGAFAGWSIVCALPFPPLNTSSQVSPTPQPVQVCAGIDSQATNQQIEQMYISSILEISAVFFGFLVVFIVVLLWLFFIAVLLWLICGLSSTPIVKFGFFFH